MIVIHDTLYTINLQLHGLCSFRTIWWFGIRVGDLYSEDTLELHESSDYKNSKTTLSAKSLLCSFFDLPRCLICLSAAT